MKSVLDKYIKKANNTVKNAIWIYDFSGISVFWLIIYTLLGLSSVILTLFTGFKSRDLVDIITQGLIGKLLKTVIMLVTYQLIQLIITNISGYIKTYISSSLEKSLKGKVYSIIMDTEWESLNDYNSGELMFFLNADVSTVSFGLLNILPNIIVNFVRLFSVLIVICQEDYSFAIVCLLSLPISLGASKISMKQMKKSNLEVIEVSSKITGIIQESFTNTISVKALDMVHVYLERMKSLQNESLETKMRYQRRTIVGGIIMSLVSMFAYYMIYGWGIYKVWKGVISYGTLTMLLTLNSSVSSSLKAITATVPSMIELSNAGSRIRNISDLPKENNDLREKAEEFATRNSENGIAVCLKDASFSYKNGYKVFENVSFEAKPRENVAVVGKSGEGKTTLLRYLLALISEKPNHGYVYAASDISKNGCDSMEISASTRPLFAYVPQGNTMFSGTLAENMRNVKPDATDEEIITALKTACAWEFVEKLPEGIYSQIRENGIGFSEGQAQRLSIARALVRKSPILLLDEATSALDLKTEAEVLKNIMMDSYPRTCIVTTHRPEVMKACSKMYVIENKKIIEKNVDQ